MRGNATRGFTLAFGEFGLKAQGRGWLTARQIEAARKAISRYAHRMGSGKGDITDYVAVITPGRIIFEIAGVSSEIAKTAFARASAKLPFDVKFVSKEQI